MSNAFWTIYGKLYSMFYGIRDWVYYKFHEREDYRDWYRREVMGYSSEEWI